MRFLRSFRAAACASWMLSSVGLAAGAGAVPDPPTAPKAPPRLLVLVAVDGLSWPRLEGYRPWYVAGLKRVLDEGWIEASAHYRHLNTETGPGHSSLSTGAPPRLSGIVGNQWFESRGKSIAARNCVEQDVLPPPGGPPSGQRIQGPGNLRIATLGDRLLEAHPEARVVSLSAKDRSAILMAGHARSDAVYWFDQVTGRFVTSAAYDPSAAAKAVVEGVNRRGAGPGRFGLAWAPLPDPAPSERVLPRPARDMLDFQVPVNGLGWNHSFTFDPRGYFPSLYLSPFMDEIVADLAVAFLQDPALGLGRRAVPDILAVSFSSQDLVSHNYGPESEENLDVLRRLDLQLGRLLQALDRLGPKGTVLLALSSDHGFLAIPEAQRARDPQFRGGRLVTGPRGLGNFPDRLNRLLDDELCLDPAARPVFGVEGWGLIYDRPHLPLRTVSGSCGAEGVAVSSATLDSVLPRVVGHFYKEEIQEVLLASQHDAWPASDPAVEFARNDFDAERSGDAFLVPRPGVLMHWDPGRGSGHGSHHDYDTHVPLVFWGGSFPAGRSPEAATPYDLAPTLAEAVGLTLPAAVGRSRLPQR